MSGFGVTVGYHRLFTHRSFRRRALAQDRARVGGFARGRRFARRLGREPPPPPRVQRQARRSALAAPARHGHRAASCAASSTRTSAGCSRATSTSAERYAPDLLDDADTQIISRLCSRCSRSFSLAAPFFLGWTLSGAIGGALTALLWAGLGPHGAAAPRDVERELDLPHVRPAARDARRTRAGTSHRSASSRSARRGTTSTTRIPRRRAMVRCATRSTRRPRSSACSNGPDG